MTSVFKHKIEKNGELLAEAVYCKAQEDKRIKKAAI
jgi:hypothetical protein